MTNDHDTPCPLGCGPKLCEYPGRDCMAPPTTEVAVPDAPRMADNTPLSQASTAALTFALGYAVARPQSANQFGPFCAMVEELSRRATGHPNPEAQLGRWDPAFEFGALMAALPTELAGQIVTLYTMQRGQRWAATGRRG